MKLICPNCKKGFEIVNPIAQAGGLTKSRKRAAASKRNGTLGGYRKTKKYLESLKNLGG